MMYDLSNRIQCLLYVIQENNADSLPRCKKMESFVELPKRIPALYPKICELLTKRKNIHLLLNGEYPVLQSAFELNQVSIIEVMLLDASDFEAFTKLRFSVTVPKHRDIVSKIFGRNVIILEGDLIPKIKFAHYCVSNVHAEQVFSMVKRLLDHGANLVDLTRETVHSALLGAISKRDVKFVNVLCTKGAFVNEDAICEAAAAGDVEVMEALLNAGNISAEMINPPFLRAAECGKLEMVKLLLRFGADINAQRSNDGSSAIHLASNASNSDMVKFLIVNNASLELQNGPGLLTPLYGAVLSGHGAVVDQLLAFGARVDLILPRSLRGLILSELQRPALYLVAMGGRKSTVEHLLDAFFQNPEFVKTNAWKTFNESHISAQGYWEHYAVGTREHFEECCADFERLLIKINAANPDFNDDEIILSWPLDDADDIRSNCENEIARMKTSIIGDTLVTFYDVLMKDVQQIIGYMRNDTVLQMLKSDDYKERFPIYASILQLQIKKGLQRRELLDMGLKICRHLFRDFMTLPLELRERIVNCLTDQNLAVLKYAVTGAVF